MKLQQGQVWKKGDDYYRIVERERLSIEYKHIHDLVTREGTLHGVTKKEFCRLIQGAELVTLDPLAIDAEAPPAELTDPLAIETPPSDAAEPTPPQPEDA